MTERHPKDTRIPGHDQLRLVKPPKRIRLGLPQLPHAHGRSRYWKLFSWEAWDKSEADRRAMEWAGEALRAEHAAIAAKPATTPVEMLEQRMEMVEASMRSHLTNSLFGVDLARNFTAPETPVPDKPPPPTEKRIEGLFAAVVIRP